MTNTLNGTASLTAHNGALVGINVEQLLRRLERRPLSGNGDFRSGRTPFDQLVLSLKIDQGMVSVEDMHIDGPAVRLAVGGQASVPMRDLDLKGTATLVSSATANEFELPFVVQGRWDDPIMLPDPQSLIRHSGAAAPLLDAVKSHAAGDAVRSVIDQLFAPPSGRARAGADQRRPHPDGNAVRRAAITVSPAAGFFDDVMLYDSRGTNQRGSAARDGRKMLNRLTRTLVKVLVASLIVGTILAHFGITTDELIKTAGLSPERIEDLAREGLAWALPNLLLGSLVIVPVWFVFYLVPAAGREPGLIQRPVLLRPRRRSSRL